MSESRTVTILREDLRELVKKARAAEANPSYAKTLSEIQRHIGDLQNYRSPMWVDTPRHIEAAMQSLELKAKYDG